MSKIVNRTLDFFEAFGSQKSPLSLTELVNILDIPLSSCHDVVRALEARGYVYEVRPRGGYYPTSKLFDLARTIVQNDPMPQRAEPLLQAICDKYKVSAWLGKAKDLEVTYLVVCNSSDPLTYKVNVGAKARGLHATSSGKALLGTLPAKEREQIVRQMTLTPLTPSTITSKSRLLADLSSGLERGWFSNREESVEDALALSVSFEFNSSLYIITVAGSVKRVDRQLQEIVGAAQAAARTLSRD